MDIKEFKENWGLTEIPTELEKLIYFQTNISSYENYSDGFGVLIDEKWETGPAFPLPISRAQTITCDGVLYGYIIAYSLL